MPIIGSSFFIIGAAPVFNALLSYQADAYPKVVGSVLAGNDLIRSSMGAAFPLFATQVSFGDQVDTGKRLLMALDV